MEFDQHVAPSGGQHYSALNKVPNIQQFMAQLDSEKKQRDEEIDAQLKKNKKSSSEVTPHTNEARPKKEHARTVRDPVTGKDVEIRDVKLDFKEAVENPQVSSSPWPGSRCEANPAIDVCSQRELGKTNHCQGVVRPVGRRIPICSGYHGAA